MPPLLEEELNTETLEEAKGFEYDAEDDDELEMPFQPWEW